MKYINKNFIFLIASIGIIILGVFFFSHKKESAPSALDGFAQCLADKGVVMYGADWCPHCQAQKKKFGESFRYVPYVECPDDPKRCIDQRIDGYPTWVFPNEKRLTGDRELSEISEASECPLPK